MFPGPNEPTQEQYNNAIEICVERFKKLYNGNFIHCLRFPAYCIQVLCLRFTAKANRSHSTSNVSDLPASRKTSGLVTYTSKYFMCDRCTVPFYALVDPDSFNSNSMLISHLSIRAENWSELNARDPWRYLKYAFRSRDASAEVAEEITRRRGVRWSTMDNLVNWLPGDTGLFDLMHCIFGGMSPCCGSPMQFTYSFWQH